MHNVDENLEHRPYLIIADQKQYPYISIVNYNKLPGLIGNAVQNKSINGVVY